MYRIILSCLIIGSVFLTYGDSVVQTDWTGGSGVLGPVTDWGSYFYLDNSLEWGSFPGDVLLQFSPEEHTADGDFDGASSVYAEDIDGDGNMDILGAARDADDITWWENTDGLGTSWTEHTVDGDFDGAYSVYSADIDGDGNMDVLGAAFADCDITWWENTDGLGTSWTEHIIDGDFADARSVYSQDINGDGDMDVLGAAYIDDDITWWENADGLGTSWIEHIVEGDFNGAWSVYASDVDDDGDMDILGAAPMADDIIWWENADGLGTSWIEHTVDEDFVGAWSVYSADIDDDGDMDVLGAAYEVDDITWWENTDGLGTSWTEHTIDGDFDGAGSVYSEDMDDDGDMDVLGSSWYASDIKWWENEDGSGLSWNEHSIDGDFNLAVSVYSEDIDSDGKMDILGAANDDNDISWWDYSNYSTSGELESSILYLGNDPDWGYIDWNASAPSGTSVALFVRASDNYADMGVWSDTITAPCALDAILNDYDSYFQYKVLLETVNSAATPSLHDITLTWDPLGIGETAEPNPGGIELLPIAPNPSSGSPTIRFGLHEPAYVDISIFDLSGRLVSENHGNEYSPGYHEFLLVDLSPGTYFCKMTSEDFTASERFVVIE